MKILPNLFPGLVIFALTACSGEQASSGPGQSADGLAPGNRQAAGSISEPVSGVELGNFDNTVAPGDDFYRYVNGTWLASTEIPPDQSNYGAFSVLADEAEANLRTIIEAAAAGDSAPGSDARKVGDFFTSFMDEDSIDALEAEPLAGMQSLIAGAASREELLAVMAELNSIGVQLPVGLFIDVDQMQSDQYITYINQSGLSLPDRDWYLSEGNPSHEQARAAYRSYLGSIMALAGYERADRVADSVFAIENRIARGHWDRVQNRQRELTYNKMSLDELNELSPAIDWELLLTSLGIDERTLIVRQPDFAADLSAIWNDIPLQQWQDYMQFKLLDAYAPYLGQDFVSTQFDFTGRVLSGTETMRERWKRGVDVVSRSLGEVLGRLYVQDHFQEQAKVRMDELVENLRAAFRVGIDELPWMTAATKVQ
ncbi:MAG: M13 family metallopeptidase N-terminal domain-containing protein, partial [Pseudohongiellaceae bacterium]